jgi:hypothetical protein
MQQSMHAARLKRTVALEGVQQHGCHVKTSHKLYIQQGLRAGVLHLRNPSPGQHWCLLGQSAVELFEEHRGTV